jgi:hypothetical protein
METSTNGVASLNDSDTEDNANLSEEDIDNLDLSFDDIAGEISDTNNTDESQEPGFFQKPAKQPSDDEGDLLKKKGGELDILSDYILGTLIVRVVAARDLEPVNRGGFGKMLFGGGNLNYRGNNEGSANPYASVRFGGTTQRTSEVFDTLDPIWPRGETMYMDVVHSALPDDLTPVTEFEPAAPLVAASDAYKTKLGQTKSVATATVTKAAAKAQAESPRKDSDNDPNEPTEPVLTVALFHASEIGKVNKYPSKKGGMLGGDSDDKFLGMAAVNLTQLLTGKCRTFDEWLPLTGSESSRACVRIVCEYEASDRVPRMGDYVRFTNFCQAADLYPAQKNCRYRVEESDGDEVLLSYTSTEGWVSSFLVHRFMLVCEQRHQAAIQMYQAELASIKDRLAYSPIASALANSITRLPDDGLVTVANEALNGGVSLLTRWMQGGAKTMVDDLAAATNWDGRYNPDLVARILSSNSMEETAQAAQAAAPKLSTDIDDLDTSLETDDGVLPLPNMPSCPITGTHERFLSILQDRICLVRLLFSLLHRFLSSELSQGNPCETLS